MKKIANYSTSKAPAAKSGLLDEVLHCVEQQSRLLSADAGGLVFISADDITAEQQQQVNTVHMNRSR